MFPIRTSSIFKSRWMALVWSASIVWMAVDYTSPPDPEPTDPAELNDSIEAVAAALDKLPAS